MREGIKTKHEEEEENANDRQKVVGKGRRKEGRWKCGEQNGTLRACNDDGRKGYERISANVFSLCPSKDYWMLSARQEVCAGGAGGTLCRRPYIDKERERESKHCRLQNTYANNIKDML